MPAPSEAQLVEQAAAGSVTAFNSLIERYREGLFRFLLARCHSHADAEDALQDTLIAAYRYLHTYDSKWRFSTWLYRIAIRNALRRPAPTAAELGEVRDAGGDPLDHAIAASERSNLWRSARRILSEEVFAALWLRYVEDMSVKEISVTLDRSLSWTKVNLLRARKALDAELSQSNGEAYG